MGSWQGRVWLGAEGDWRCACYSFEKSVTIENGLNNLIAVETN